MPRLARHFQDEKPVTLSVVVAVRRQELSAALTVEWRAIDRPNVPAVGSNHRAPARPESFVVSTVMGRMVGKYAMTNLPSGLLAAAT